MMKLMYLLINIFNPLMAAMLRSPLHGLVSKQIMLITVTGRKTGRTYTTPVSYCQDGDTICCFTDRSGKWWKNLRGGVAVTVRVRGQSLQGRATVVDDDKARIAEGIRRFLAVVRSDARFYGVTFDADGQPNAAECARAAENVVMVEIRTL